MANTKIPVELSSTPGIVDNSDATAITITSDEDFLVRQTSADVFDTNTGSTNRQFWGNQFSAANNTNSKVMIGSASNAGLIGGSTVNSGGTKFILNSYINFGSTNQTAGSEAGMVQFYTSTGGGIAAVRARIDSDGLKFGSDTAAANALDDYEEGTWTPQITGSAGSAGTAAYSNQVGTYTKIGNKVFFKFSVVMTNKGSWSSYTRVLGFPFTTNSTGLTAFAVARFPDDTIGANMIAGELQPSSTLCFFTTGSRLDTLHNISNVDTGYYLIGAGHYTI